MEGVAVHGPRSISKLARKIGIPGPTVRDRVKTLRSRFSLLLQAKVYHTFIGLKKAFIFARATSGNERLLWEAMKANGYWLYLAARYDTPESFYGIYGIPIGHTDQFHQYVEQLQDLKIARTVDEYWSTCIQDVSLTGRWYNHESESWDFRWSEWIEDVRNQGTSLPYTIQEPKSYPQKADETDIFILKELQKDATVNFEEIAELLDASPQHVRYHYENHVVGRGLIEGYSVFLPHFESVSDTYCFRFNFSGTTNMSKFGLSLMDKPFVRSIGKIISENALSVHIYIPRKHFREFTDSLRAMIREDLLRDYEYIIEDPSRKQGQTIPYKSFKGTSWIYNHEAHIARLIDLSQNGICRAIAC